MYVGVFILLFSVSCSVRENYRGVRFRKEEQLLKAEEEAKRRMEGADARRKEHRRGIVRKANDANSKVRCRVLRIFRVYASMLVYSLQCSVILLFFICLWN